MLFLCYLYAGFTKLPSLFLKDLVDEINDLVLLDPKWLIDVMKELMELQDVNTGKVDRRKPVYDNNDLDNLEDQGIASENLLRKCLEGYYSEREEAVTFLRLCRMLQAYGLIYPVEGNPPVNASDEMPGNSSLSQSLSKGISTSTSISSSHDFLVPCMLPDKENLHECPGWITFYFDFLKFLPEVVYHRLICLMLAESKQHSVPLTKEWCIFSDIGGFENSRWKIELSKDLHKLQISVK